jgi:SAM-dependent methyltransferase
MSRNPDPLSGRYDRLYGRRSGPATVVRLQGWPRHRNEAVLYLADGGGRLLEIGCGEGALLSTLAASFGEAVGIELSRMRAEQAKENLAHMPNCRVLDEPLERLPALIEEPFDCIVWADVIEHVVDVIGAMRLIANMSRPRTQLITVTPNAAYLLHRLRSLLGHAPNTSLPSHRNAGFAANPGDTVLLDGGHLHYFSFQQVEMLYEMAGFRPTRRLGFGGRLSRLRNVWPTLLSGAVCVSGIYQGVGS